MHVSVLEWLRCPFCGTRATIVDTSPQVRLGDDLVSGVLGCECCAYPVVAGIPVLIADDTTRSAMHQLESGQDEAALLTLLGLDGERAETFSSQLGEPGRMTYRSAIETLSPDPEGIYFLYRFSDPTFVMAQSVLQALGTSGAGSGRAVDLCGGSGHLTRVLLSQNPAREVVLADVFFWKLWLARTFTAPQSIPVCCDANNPLPFARETFHTAVLSDAFPYIWHKRLLADEMMRLLEPGGAVIMPHLHSSLGENFSAGMTLAPASYRDLFEPLSPRLFSDTALLDGILGRGVVDLGADVGVAELDGAPSFTLIASKDEALFTRASLQDPDGVEGELRANPLYRVRVAGSESVLTLAFPNGEYEEEFGECKRYLPPSVTIPGDATGVLDAAALGPNSAHLRRARIVIDVPRGYC